MSYMSRKDSEQCIRAAFNDETGRLMTDATFTGELTVNLTAENDSVAISDGEDTMTVNADGSINTSIVGTVVLDIDAATDNIAISDGTDTLLINADGSINSNITNNLLTDTQLRATPIPVSGSISVTGGLTDDELRASPVPISATNLDIRNLVFAEDKVDITGSEVSLDATTLAALENTTVSATDLDIRDLLHTQDSVRIGDGTDLVNVTTAGELNVIATAQSGVDIGDVTINNAAGAAAVNVQDGGNSITVDGTVAASEDHNYGIVGVNTLRTAAQIGNVTGAADFNAGATGVQTLRVTANAGVNLNTSALALDSTVTGLLTDTQLRASPVAISVASLPLPTGAATETTLGTRLSESTFTSRINTLGQKTSANSTPVVIASDQSTLPTSQVGFSGMSVTRPAISNTSSTILAANANRRYVMIYNQSGSTIFISLGPSSAVVNQGIKLLNDTFYEINSTKLFTGAIQCIKNGASSQNLDIFEGS